MLLRRQCDNKLLLLHNRHRNLADKIVHIFVQLCVADKYSSQSAGKFSVLVTAASFTGEEGRHVSVKLSLKKVSEHVRSSICIAVQISLFTSSRNLWTIRITKIGTSRVQGRCGNFAQLNRGLFINPDILLLNLIICVVKALKDQQISVSVAEQSDKEISNFNKFFVVQTLQLQLSDH